MPVLANARHEQFCQHRATGKTLDESYKLAGYRDSPTTRMRAHDLSTKVYIKARIAELQAHTVAKYEITIESIARELDEARELAIKCNQPGAMVAASLGKAKLAGLLIEKASVQVSHSYSTMTIEEIRFEIASIHAEARRLKAGVRH